MDLHFCLKPKALLRLSHCSSNSGNINLRVRYRWQSHLIHLYQARWSCKRPWALWLRMAGSGSLFWVQSRVGQVSPAGGICIPQYSIPAEVESQFSREHLPVVSNEGESLFQWENRDEGSSQTGNKTDFYSANIRHIYINIFPPFGGMCNVNKRIRSEVPRN